MGSNVKRFDPQFSLVSSEQHFAQRVVLVAGGAGFIGSNLCRRLLSQGNRVICVDNLETGRLSNIGALMSEPDFRFFLHDIVEPFSIKGQLDRIYNLACPASPPKYQKDPIHTFQTSVMGALNLLELASKKGARVLQSSTSEVYGDPDVSPQNEEYRGLVNTMGPRSCYDEGKRAAETLFHDMHVTRGVDVRVARIFNTYGPRMDPEDGRVISNFIVQALKGEPMTIYGTGEQTRSFCYIDDMLEGLMALMECETCGAVPVNLGNPGEFTMNELSRLVQKMIPGHGGAVYCDLPKDDPRQRRPDITRARTLLNWAPQVSLRAGLVPTVTYFSKELELSQEQAGSGNVINLLAGGGAA
ncbi:UDP-glucuronic acid decarboxylase family protein [Celeribacter sp. SCSIO 80788]|jgi:UDP-glucuronate decarboxylase|uniref:UDP-glucuronic acid decarboxylase family protein n=1 Tax=Celeribacter sp. SCSIO 80788 TaxID=3117013 RepID=UPI003DA32C75